MFFRFLCVSFPLLAGLASPLSLSGFDHFTPYHDRHFHLDGTPISGTHTSAANTYVSGGSHASATTGHSVSTGCSQHGSRGPNCPAVDNALLRLHLPDHLQVEINGYKTKSQTLGGIHRNSRIYSLTGLRVDRISTCDICVIEHDGYGNQIHHCTTISVSAGQTYTVRFPQDFDSAPVHISPPVQPMMTYPIGGTYQPPAVQVNKVILAPIWNSVDSDAN